VQRPTSGPLRRDQARLMSRSDTSMSTTTPVDEGHKQTSPTTPRTPIRAISSKISTKSTPSLPSPTECYEPQVKTVFRHRLQISLLVSAAYTYAVINAWALFQAGGIAKVGLWGALWLLINPRTMCTTLVAWTIMAVPVTLLRRLFLTCMYRVF
jgi:nucleoporin NDC1